MLNSKANARLLMTRGRFRGLVVAWALVSVWWSTLPYSAYKQPQVVREALEHAARGAIVPPTDTLADLSLAAVLLAAAGLLFFQRWGRALLVLTTLFSLVLSPLGGVMVSGPFDGTLGFVLTLLTGALIALAYWSPVAAEFVKRRDEDLAAITDDMASEPEPDEQLVTVYETSNATVVPVIHSLLQSADIEYTTTSESLQDLVAGGRLSGYNAAAGTVRFLVRESDALLARDVLAVEGK